MAKEESCDKIKISYKEIWAAIEKIKEKKPTIHSVTSYIMEKSASAILALGASPVMAYACEEVSDIASYSDAVVINIGTLTGTWMSSIKEVCDNIHKKKIPLVLDAVGSGVTKYRADFALNILENYPISVLRGNASEISALEQSNFSQVEACNADSSLAVYAARNIAKKYKTLVCLSGKVDYITDGNKLHCVRNGSEMVSRVTMMGGVLSSLVATFASIEKDDLARACIMATATMGIVSELAEKKSKGCGSFNVKFLDILSNLKESWIKKNLNVGGCCFENYKECCCIF